MKFTVSISKNRATETVYAENARSAARIAVNRHPDVADTRVGVNGGREYTGFYLTPKQRLTVKAEYRA